MNNQIPTPIYEILPYLYIIIALIISLFNHLAIFGSILLIATALVILRLRYEYRHHKPKQPSIWKNPYD